VADLGAGKDDCHYAEQIENLQLRRSPPRMSGIDCRGAECHVRRRPRKAIPVHVHEWASSIPRPDGPAERILQDDGNARLSPDACKNIPLTHWSLHHQLTGLDANSNNKLDRARQRIRWSSSLRSTLGRWKPDLRGQPSSLPPRTGAGLLQACWSRCQA